MNGAGKIGAFGALANLCAVENASLHTGGNVLTYEDQEANRLERMNEVGTEPLCPFCQKPRVSRSDYVRCNPCAVNWLNEEMHLTFKGKPYLEVDPRLARSEAARTVSATKPIADTSVAAASV